MASTRDPQKLDRIPNTYWGITEYRPTQCLYPNDSDACWQGTMCIACSPLIVPVWTLCLFAVTGKKMVKCCHACTNYKNSKTVNPITIQPKPVENPSTIKHPNIPDRLK